MAAIILGLVVALVETGEAHAPATQGRNPNGRTGSSGSWKPEWTRMFNECFNRHGGALKANYEGNQIPDKGEFCAQTNNVPAAKFWLSIFIPLAEKESSFREKARGRNQIKVRGRGGRTTLRTTYPLGLYQMDVNDMRRHKCVGSDPTDANMAICCAVQIANNLASGSNGFSKHSHITSQRTGILASFFQPIRTGMGGDGRGGKINNAIASNFIKQKAKQLCQSQEIEAPGNQQQGTPENGRPISKGDVNGPALACLNEENANG